MDEVNQATNREDYIRAQEKQLQKWIVNVKTAETSTNNSTSWTFRTTACDVISVITTNKVIGSGEMHDIKNHEAPIKRIKPPTKKPGILLNNPLEDIVISTVDNNQVRLNDALLSERKTFMNKLSFARKLRGKAENVAALVIQSYYRRHFVMKNRDDIKMKLALRRRYRQGIQQRLLELQKQKQSQQGGVGNEENSSNPVKELLIRLQKQYRNGIANPQLQHGDVKRQHSPNITDTSSSGNELQSLRVYRNKYNDLRNSMISRIQRGYRCCLSRKVLRTKRIEYVQIRRRWASNVIQAIVRLFVAKMRVGRLMSKKRKERLERNALFIQKAYRRTYCKKRVLRRRYQLHYIAARMIQCWFRILVAKHCVRKLNFTRRNALFNKSAAAIQRLARGYVCRCLGRLQRIRARKEFLVKYNVTTKIQRIVRRFLAKCVVNARRIRLKELRSKQAAFKQEQNRKELEAEQEKERQALMDGMDVFLQASKGDALVVGDLMAAALEEYVPGFGPHPADAVNTHGDNVLTIAINKGYIDIVRKCILMWGFDVNFRSVSNESILMLAVRVGNFDIVQYLLKQCCSLNEADATKEDLARRTIVDISKDDAATMCIDAVKAGAATKSTALLNALLDFNIEKSRTIFDINSKHPDTGVSAMHTICEYGFEEAYEMVSKIPLVPKNSDYASLDLTKSGGLFVSEAQIDYKSQDEMSQTLLHKACYSNSVHIVMSLLNCVYDKATSRYVNTTLVLAEQDARGSKEVEENESSPASPVAVGGSGSGAALGAEEGVLDNEADEEARLRAEEARILAEQLAIERKEAREEALAFYRSWSARITRTDVDGKDCQLIAAVHGQSEVLSLLQALVKQESDDEAVRKKVEAEEAAEAARAAEEERLRIVAEEEAAAAALAAAAPPTGEEKVETPVASAESEGESAVEKAEVPNEEAKSGEEPENKNESTSPGDNQNSTLNDDANADEQAVDAEDAKDSEEEEAEVEEIGWSPNDINSVLNNIVNHGKTDCLRYLLDIGYDPLWGCEDTGEDCLMRACYTGQYAIVDQVLKHLTGSQDADGDSGIDVSDPSSAKAKKKVVSKQDIEDLSKVFDKHDRGLFHYAAMGCQKGVIPYLLSHDQGHVCKIDPMMLCCQDKDGYTALHIAIYLGFDLISDIELLAKKAIGKCLMLKDVTYGFTPLLLACNMRNSTAIEIMLGLNKMTVHTNMKDKNGHNGLWNLYHYTPIELPRIACKSKRSVGDIHMDTGIVIQLLQSQCKLFTNDDTDSLGCVSSLKLAPALDIDLSSSSAARSNATPHSKEAVAERENIRNDINNSALSAMESAPPQDIDMDSVELMIKNNQLEMIRAIATELKNSSISYNNVWRIVLLCIQYTTNPILEVSNFLEKVEGKANGSESRDSSDAADAPEMSVIECFLTHGGAERLAQANAADDMVKILSPGISNTTDSSAIPAYYIALTKLLTITYGGYTLLGWCIRLKNIHMVKYLFKMYLNVTTIGLSLMNTSKSTTNTVSEASLPLYSINTILDVHGNTALHLALKYSVVEVIEPIFSLFNSIRKVVVHHLGNTSSANNTAVVISICPFQFQLSDMLYVKYSQVNLYKQNVCDVGALYSNVVCNMKVYSAPTCSNNAANRQMQSIHPRSALNQCTYSYILARTKRCEAFEINMNTGIGKYDEDDVLYFPMHHLGPDYIVWYK